MSKYIVESRNIGNEENIVEVFDIMTNEGDIVITGCDGSQVDSYLSELQTV
jgi:hypothetical protein